MSPTSSQLRVEPRLIFAGIASAVNGAIQLVLKLKSEGQPLSNEDLNHGILRYWVRAGMTRKRWEVRDLAPLLRTSLIALAALTSIPATLWLAVAIHTLFYDSMGNYRTSTFGHIAHNLLFGIAPFAVPVAFVLIARCFPKRHRSRPDY